MFTLTWVAIVTIYVGSLNPQIRSTIYIPTNTTLLTNLPISAQSPSQIFNITGSFLLANPVIFVLALGIAIIFVLFWIKGKMSNK